MRSILVLSALYLGSCSTEVGTSDSAPNCTDGEKNGDETGVDCGGPCQACAFDPSCGNGLLEEGENCDDGNVVDDDFCSNLCELPSCGDGIVQPGEACDDGNASLRAAMASCRWGSRTATSRATPRRATPTAPPRAAETGG